MKLFRPLLLFSALLFISSCSFFNKKTVQLGIDSNPSGANIFINGMLYGRTPIVLEIAPKIYTVNLMKDGYGSTSFSTDIWWGTVRTDVNGLRTPDGTRCFLDMMSIIFSFNAYNSTRCGDFKQKKYLIEIPNNAVKENSNSENPSNIRGIFKQSQSDIYNQDFMSYDAGYYQ